MKELSRESRLYIAEKLMSFAFNIAPKDSELRIIVIHYFSKINRK